MINKSKKIDKVMEESLKDGKFQLKQHLWKRFK